jgi:choline dehydrogenase-like flavoprotein
LVTYKTGKKGIQNLVNGLLKLGECLFEAGAIELYPAVYESSAIKNISQLKDFIKKLTPERLNLMTIHLFSSCPMGENKDICVTDSYGRVHGQDNLFINDASLLCTAPTVNPQGTIMMLARRNAEHFLENY